MKETMRTFKSSASVIVIHDHVKLINLAQSIQHCFHSNPSNVSLCAVWCKAKRAYNETHISARR